MYFCQDCGGANAAQADSCRICGKALIRERDGAPCLRCGGATAEGANFCSVCGATAIATKPAAASTGNRSAEGDDTVVSVGQVDAPGDGVNLGDGLELPEWLKRAAAEQPFDATASRQMAVNANPYGPLGGSTATLDVGRSDGDASGPPADFVLGAQAPLSIPAEEIDALVARETSANHGDKEPNDLKTAARGSSSDSADTSTFISENDLPDWIRQLAAADEARKLEEARLADAALAAQQAASDADPRQRKPLPGEIAVAPGSNPWLARRDRTDDTDQAVADSWGKPATGELRGAAPDSTAASAGTALESAAPQSEPAAASSRPQNARGQQQLRLAAIAAAALLIVVLVAILAFM